MGKPAARVTDMTSDTGMVTGPGASTVLINGLPAARVGDMHVTPMVLPGTPPVPLVGGPIIGPGCANVFIGKMPAAVTGDMVVNSGPPATVVLGSPNVFIGMNSSSSVSGGGGVGASGALISALIEGRLSPVDGTESLPVKIQAAVLQVMQDLEKSGQDFDPGIVESIIHAEKGKGKKRCALTIADIVEILKTIQSEESYEAARFFASELDFLRLCEMTAAFINGEDTNPGNDPNIMPTRFMILFGADDSKLKEIDLHPDNFKGRPDHRMNVANLTRALRISGHDIEESKVYDIDIFMAHLAYLKWINRYVRKYQDIHVVQKGETFGTVASTYGLVSWKHLYEFNRETAGENPDLLRPDIKLKIPKWDSTTGDELLEAKGAQSSLYTGGIKYRYPWIPLSFSMVTGRGELYCEERADGARSPVFGKSRKYQIANRSNGEIIEEGKISGSDELEILLPHTSGIVVQILAAE